MTKEERFNIDPYIKDTEEGFEIDTLAIQKHMDAEIEKAYKEGCEHGSRCC